MSFCEPASLRTRKIIMQSNSTLGNRHNPAIPQSSNPEKAQFRRSTLSAVATHGSYQWDNQVSHVCPGQEAEYAASDEHYNGLACHVKAAWSKSTASDSQCPGVSSGPTKLPHLLPATSYLLV